MSSVLSRKKMGLDRRVWFSMLATVVISFALVSYRLMEDKSCMPFTISVKSLTNNSDKIYEVGETLIFKTSLAEQKEMTWHFGDNTEKERTSSANVRHKFMQEGSFTVRAMVNSVCKNVINVNIKKTQNTGTSANNSNVVSPKIFGNATPVAGKAERYISDAIGSAYEWKILDKATFPTINDQYAFYTFTKPGIYILQLTVDHDRKKRSQMEIMVTEDLAKTQAKKPEKPVVLIPFDVRPPKKEEPKPEKEAEKQPEKQPEKPVEAPVASEAPQKKIIRVSNEIFRSLLEGVVQGQKEVGDFDKYLAYGGDTKVRVNDSKSLISFRQFCSDIRGKKKITIESVELLRDETSQIQQMRVKYKKSSFLGL